MWHYTGLRKQQSGMLPMNILKNLWLVRDSSSLLEPTEKFSIFDQEEKGVPRVLVLAGSTIQTCDSSIQQHMDGDSSTWCNKELTHTRDHQEL